MQVKCPKCRFRYDTPVAAGITEIACVCPRCGTPFAHTITDDDLSQPSSDSLAAGDGAAQTGRADGMHAVHTADGTPQHLNVSTSPHLNVAARPAGALSERSGERTSQHPNVETSQHPNVSSSDQWIKHTIPAGKPQQGRGRRGCLRNCLIVFLLMFVVLVFTVRNCFGDRSYKQAMLEQGVNQSLDEFGDEAVVRDVDEFVEIHPEPIPDWLEGAWRVETNYGVITITIHGNKIAEESGGEISRGTFYYKQGKLYCDFGDGELAIRRLNMKRKCIDAGDGMLMEKQ